MRAIRLVPQILLCLANSIVFAGDDSIPNITYLQHVRTQASFTAERLHRLKIQEIASLEESMEFALVVDAKVLHKMLEIDEISEVESSQIYQTLRLLSVMNEKFDIQQWRDDPDVMSIFREAQEHDPEHTEKLRCLDWSKPMWTNSDECT